MSTVSTAWGSRHRAPTVFFLPRNTRWARSTSSRKTLCYCGDQKHCDRKPFTRAARWPPRSRVFDGDPGGRFTRSRRRPPRTPPLCPRRRFDCDGQSLARRRERGGRERCPVRSRSHISNAVIEAASPTTRPRVVAAGRAAATLSHPVVVMGYGQRRTRADDVAASPRKLRNRSRRKQPSMCRAVRPRDSRTAVGPT
jgi:hypothetical protein